MHDTTPRTLLFIYFGVGCVGETDGESESEWQREADHTEQQLPAARGRKNTRTGTEVPGYGYCNACPGPRLIKARGFAH